MENPWYGLWALELLRITEPFNNIVVVPQYALWYTMPAEELACEEAEEIGEDSVSEDDDDDDTDADGEDENNDQDDSEDELDCFRDKDEGVEPIKQEYPHAEDTEQDPDTSIALSLFTIPDGSAPEVFPDFVVLHILAKELKAPTNALLRHRYERRGGFRIIHECCPLVMEIKSFPERRLKPTRLRKEIVARLDDAKQDLGFQCYHLFKKYEHALK